MKLIDIHPKNFALEFLGLYESKILHLMGSNTKTDDSIKWTNYIVYHKEEDIQEIMLENILTDTIPLRDWILTKF